MSNNVDPISNNVDPTSNNMDWVGCWSAAQRGNLQKVRQWLQTNEPFALFRLAIIAAINDHADVLTLILVHIECTAFAPLSMVDIVQLVLCKAAFHGSLCVLRVLLADYIADENMPVRYKADANMPLPWSGIETYRFPICAAIQGHQLAVVGALLQAKCRVDTTYTNAPCEAVSHLCHPRLIAKICKATVWETTSTRDQHYCSLLQSACEQGSAPAASVMLTHIKVDVNGGCGGNHTSLRGHTPLRYAAERGHTEVVKLLLRHKADVYKRSTSGNTALSKARANHHDDIVRLLLDAGTSADEDYAEDYAYHADTDSADAFW